MPGKFYAYSRNGLDAAFTERVPTPVVKQSADISDIKAQIAGCVGVRRNGEREIYKINSRLLFESLSASERPRPRQKSVETVTRLVSSMLASADFAWNIFCNIPRDFAAALSRSKTDSRRRRLLPNILRSYGASFPHEIRDKAITAPWSETDGMKATKRRTVGNSVILCCPRRRHMQPPVKKAF